MLKRIALLLLLFPIMNGVVAAEPLDKVVALVNDGVITESELNTQVEVMRQQLTARKVAIPEEKLLKKQVLQHLIDVDLQLQLAKQNDLSIDSSELNESITRIAETNKLTLDELRAAVEKEGMNWETYRENIRKEILISRVQQKAVGHEVNVTNEQIDDYIKAMQSEPKPDQSYHLQNLVIPLPEDPTTDQLTKAREKAKLVADKLKKGDDFDRTAIAESSNEFAIQSNDLGERHLAELPEVFAREVVHMKVGQVAGPIRTGNGFQIIKLLGAGAADEKHQVVKTHVRHILIKQDASMTTEEAQKQASNLYQQLKAGKDFAELAKQYSLDVASAVKGGDLGWVTAGELVPEFERTMDSLPLNMISKPVKSGFGWHLIEVLERKKIDDSNSFKRQQVRQYLQQRKFTEAVQNWQQHIRTDAYVSVMDKELA